MKKEIETKDLANKRLIIATDYSHCTKEIAEYITNLGSSDANVLVVSGRFALVFEDESLVVLNLYKA